MSNDLDLDELHAQVSKLMDQASKPKAKKAHVKVADKSEPAEPPKESPEPSKSEEHKEHTAEPVKAEDYTPEKKEESTPIAVRRPAAAIVPKRQGIAMDIVQPAKPAQLAPPSVRASRTSPTLQPTGPVAAEPPRPREASAPTPAPESAKSKDVSEETLASLNLQKDSPRAAAVLDAVPEHAKATFPDPLEAHGFGGEEEKKPDLPATPPTMEHKSIIEPDTPQPDTVTSETDPVQEAPGEAAPETTGTPFVNAKVEKRPLGAFATTPTEVAPTEVPIIPDEPKGDIPRDDKPTDLPTTPTPKELDPELVAVESSEPEFTPTTPPAPRATVNDLRQMAIPPQYKTNETEPSKDDRPIFDTKTYHPPIAPPAKAHKGGGSKAGMVLTLTLIILIVLAGVAAYFVATGAVDVNSILKSLNLG
ncbi:MAG TPA: hypothetical protein VLA88_00335 [Candidatus Saccharimonadales bacterium]|nr:hypothetical protein [Candidatus Saccharimonadales bacterium]